MRIQYIGQRPREIAAPGRSITVTPGEVFEVGETLGRSLLEQTRRFRAAPAAEKPEPKGQRRSPSRRGSTEPKEETGE